jgi:hypothetical protein
LDLGSRCSVVRSERHGWRPHQTQIPPSLLIKLSSVTRVSTVAAWRREAVLPQTEIRTQRAGFDLDE